MTRLRALLAVASFVALAALPARGAAGPSLGGATIVLERGPCYGTCPVYRVEVHGDGRVRFAGESFVRTKHPRPYRISSARARALFAACERARFFDLPDVASWGSCRCPVATDNPSATLTLTLHGRMRTLVHDYGCRCAPPALTELAAAVDDAARVRRWIGHGREGGLAW